MVPRASPLIPPTHSSKPTSSPSPSKRSAVRSCSSVLGVRGSHHLETSVTNFHTSLTAASMETDSSNSNMRRSRAVSPNGPRLDGGAILPRSQMEHYLRKQAPPERFARSQRGSAPHDDADGHEAGSD